MAVYVIDRLLPKNGAFQYIVHADNVEGLTPGGGGGPVPFGCNIVCVAGRSWIAIVKDGRTFTGWSLVGNDIGNLVVDIKTCLLANYPAGLASITASDKPTLSAAQTAEGSCTGWSGIAANETTIVEFSVESVSGPTKAVLLLTYEAA